MNNVYRTHEVSEWEDEHTTNGSGPRPCACQKNKGGRLRIYRIRFIREVIVFRHHASLLTMLKNNRSFIAHLVLLLSLIAALYLSLGREPIHAAGPLVGQTWIIDSWLEEPHLLVSYIWNLYERRDGWYLQGDNWSDNQLAAVDTYEFGVREVFKLMQTSAQIDAHHNGDAWIQLYNVATNGPAGTDSDYPPHINIISYWGVTGHSYDGDINGHFYVTEQGPLDPAQTWYAWDIDPNCERGVRNPPVNTWIAHVDRECAVLWEERVTPAGELQLRRGPNAPIYTVRSRGPSLVTILRDAQHVRSVERVFHNAWINYPQPYPDGIARVVWEICDFEAGTLTTETITANPETGHFITHERVARALENGTCAKEMIYYLPQVHR